MDELMMPAAADTPLRELIVGFDDVASGAIPYARLPRRAGSDYSTEFVRWSDIAEQTVHLLLSRRRGAGEAAVGAVLAVRYCYPTRHARPLCDGVTRPTRTTNSSSVRTVHLISAVRDLRLPPSAGTV
jgi:hypothetical protein